MLIQVDKSGSMGVVSQKLKNLLAQGFHESLERLEGKTREGPFFKVQSGRITVCSIYVEWFSKFRKQKLRNM